jgi:phospholipase/lecithinase/hemolysin
MIMKRKLASLVAGLVFLLTGANVWATAFTGLYAFGDSLSDSGSSASSVLSIYNLVGGCDPFHPCPPYYDGRYSNGPVAVEYLAASVAPTNFSNFAVSGATSGVGNYGDGGTAITPGVYGLPGLAQEVGYYLTLSGGVADPDALYFIWGGANDFITSYVDPILAAQSIAGYVGALAATGAEHFLVPNLPDMGLTPFIISVGLEAEAHAYVTAFNAELAGELADLSAELPSTDIVLFDVFSLLNDVMQNPADYGLTNTVDACLPSIYDAPCADPENYVSWDGFHPTTAVHGILGRAFARSVPEPGSIALLAVGLFALMTAGRKSARAGRRL